MVCESPQRQKRFSMLVSFSHGNRVICNHTVRSIVVIVAQHWHKRGYLVSTARQFQRIILKTRTVENEAERYAGLVAGTVPQPALLQERFANVWSECFPMPRRYISMVRKYWGKETQSMAVRGERANAIVQDLSCVGLRPVRSDDRDIHVAAHPCVDRRPPTRMPAYLAQELAPQARRPTG